MKSNVGKCRHLKRKCDKQEDITMSIALIIPSLEPDQRFIDLLKTLEGQISFDDVFVVNDGSSESYDHYFEKARQMGCHVMRHSVNLGKGRALKTAFNQILQEPLGYAGVVIADSDGQHSVKDILRCMKALEDRPESLVLGCRNFYESHVPFKSRMGNLITRNVMKILCGVQISDTQTGLRGISREFMKILMNVSGERFEFETNMLLAAKENNIPIHEVEIQTIYLDGNASTHFRPLQDSLLIYALFGKFLLASGSSFLVDILLFTLLVWLLKGTTAEYILVATIGARVVSSAYNYLVNKKGVFKNKEKGMGTLLRYYALCIVQMLASAGLVTLVFGWLGGNETIWKMVVDGLLFVVSFQIQREWVFAKK